MSTPRARRDGNRELGSSGTMNPIYPEFMGDKMQSLFQGVNPFHKDTDPRLNITIRAPAPSAPPSEWLWGLMLIPKGVTQSYGHWVASYRVNPVPLPDNGRVDHRKEWKYSEQPVLEEDPQLLARVVVGKVHDPQWLSKIFASIKVPSESTTDENVSKAWTGKAYDAAFVACAKAHKVIDWPDMQSLVEEFVVKTYLNDDSGVGRGEGGIADGENDVPTLDLLEPNPAKGEEGSTARKESPPKHPPSWRRRLSDTLHRSKQ